MVPTAVSVSCLVVAGVSTAVGLALFIRGIAAMARLIAAGAPEGGRWNPLGMRIWTAVKVTVLHTTFKQRPVVRVAHWLVMVSFVALVLTLVTSYAQLFDPLFALPLIGESAWWGWTTEILAFLGLISILALFGIRTFLGFRYKGDPRESRFFGSTRWQAWFVESVVALVTAAVLFSHALRFALLSSLRGSPVPSHYPLTAWLGRQWAAANPETLAALLVVVATVKILVSMGWMTVTGLDVAMGISWHRFLAPVNIMTGTNADGKKSLGALPLPLVQGKPVSDLDAAAEEDPDLVIGIGTPADLTWKDRLDVLSCTECGRCQDLCPAWNTEKPLSPKLLIMAMRDNAVASSGLTMPGQQHADTKDVLKALSSVGASGPDGVPSTAGPLVPDTVASQVLWDCTMCGACVDQCPVDIEHVNHVGNLRRYQFLMESAFPRQLTRPMRGMETKSNPYNQSPRKRLDWAKNLDFPLTVVGEDVEDASGLDYLFWVGCAGAYDEKAKKTTAAVAELLHVAGVSFGVLGSQEGCTGDPARRAGNEVLFQMLAAASIETLNEVKAKRIVVTCAHCFNSMLNEFPQLGGAYEIIHHTQLLNTLLRDGLLKPVPAEEKERRRVTYHDPCFLGRYNDIYEAPRELLDGIPELELVEMKQSKSLAMCCGAGGAHAWFDESPQGPRIASVRMEQVQATGATTVATACPYCTQMLGSSPTSVLSSSSGVVSSPTGALGEAGGDGQTPGSETRATGVRDIEVKDVAMLLLEGVRRGQQGNHPRR